MYTNPNQPQQPQKPLFFSRKIARLPIGTWCILGFIAIMVLGAIFSHSQASVQGPVSSIIPVDPTIPVHPTIQGVRDPHIDHIIQQAGVSGHIKEGYDPQSQEIQIIDDWPDMFLEAHISQRHREIL